MRRRTRPLAVAVAGLALVLAGCFEEPVRETLELHFQPNGATEQARVELEVTVLVPDEEIESYPLRNRLEGERYRLLQGEDDWSPRFDRLDSAAHETTFEREHGVLSGIRQTAVVDVTSDPEAIGRFFSDTLVSAVYRSEDGFAELSLQPLAAGRASQRQRQRLERALDPWTEALARHFAAAAGLYAYLDEHPERAEVCLSVLLEDVLPEEDGGRRPLLLPDEEPMVEAVEETMAEAWEVLVIAAQEAYSLNEISRLVYDPFPARLRVVPGGAVAEVEGFLEDGEGGLRVTPISLWAVLDELEGRWLSPDPLLLYVRQSGGPDLAAGGERFDLAEILALERFYAPPPRAAEIRLALETGLAPAPLYRVVWKLGD